MLRSKRNDNGCFNRMFKLLTALTINDINMKDVPVSNREIIFIETIKYFSIRIRFKCDSFLMLILSYIFFFFNRIYDQIYNYNWFYNLFPK